MNWYLDVLKKYAVFSGRARRMEYWMFGLVSALIYFGIAAVEMVTETAPQIDECVFANIYSLLVLIPSLAVSVRRLHDTNRSGWNLLLCLIPVIGAVVLLVLMLTDSHSGDNQYGPNPKAAADASRSAASTPKIVGLILVTVVVGIVIIAMPAVRQAREAAWRTQSRNNLKQIGLAIHKYHDGHRGFPAGTHPNEKLEPDERLSWLASILPYVDQSALHQRLDFDEAWDNESNEPSANTRVPTYTNPGGGTSSGGPGETHYVGIAGLGKDGPTLPATSNRAGVFAINRQTRIRDITDGTSNTMMTSEASEEFGPWISGGHATIRPLTEKPYINGPDGIGGPFQGGVQVGFADGSVQFIPGNIDPIILEHLSTIAGGRDQRPFDPNEINRTLTPEMTRDAEEKPPQGVEDQIALKQSIKIENLKPAKASYTQGEPVRVTYDVVNSSEGRVSVPLNTTSSRPMHIVGALQAWIEPVQAESITAESGRAGRRSNRRDVGATVLSVNKSHLEPGERLHHVSVLGDSLTSGRYRYHAELRDINDGSLLSEATLEFRIKAIPVPDENPDSPFTLEFNGADNHVAIPSLKPDWTSAFTLEAWVKPSILSRHNEFLCDAQAAGIVFGLNDETCFMMLHDGRQYRRVAATEPARLAEETHVAGVFDGEMLTLFVNGKPQGPGTAFPRPAKLSGFPLYLGANPQPNRQVINAFAGTLDEVRISDTARYQDEFKPSRRFTTDPQTIALFHFDKGSDTVAYDYSGNNHHGQIRGAKWNDLNLKTSEPPAWFVALKQTGAEMQTGSDGKVISIAFRGNRFTDSELVHLQGLTDLKFLNLNDTRVTDTGLAHLKGLTSLQALYVGSRITDVGLTQLQGLTSLKSVGLNSNQITDAGLDHLQGLTSLESLFLQGPHVTDDGLERLKGLTSLKSLSLRGTQVTDDGKKELEAALPDCRIMGVMSTGQRLNNASWKTVGKAHLTRTEYDKALRQIQEAVAFEPSNGAYLNTLGVAQYRVGDYDAALVTLTQSEELKSRQSGGSSPTDLVFLAMVNQQLGKTDLAREQLQQVRLLSRQPRWSRNRELRSFLQEAEGSEQVQTLEQRAEQGNAIAQATLANAYRTGEGVPQDDTEAFKWYRKAAEQGVATAQRVVGHAYRTGSGVKQDSVEAYAWFAVATSANQADGAQTMDQVKGEVEPHLLGKAEALATEYINKYGSRKNEARAATAAPAAHETLTLKGHTNNVGSVSFSPDGRRIVSGSKDTTVKVWDAETGQQRLTLNGHFGMIRSVRFSPDSKWIVAGGGEKGNPGEMKVWDAETGQEMLTLKGHTAAVFSVSVSPDGKRIVSAARGGTIKVWDAETGQETLGFQGHAGNGNSVSFSPDGKWIVSGGSDKTARLWDAETGQEKLALTGHTGSVISVAFSPDGKQIVSGSEDKTVSVWDAASGQQILTLKGHAHGVYSVSFSPDGTRIVSGSRDKNVKLWDAATGHEIQTLKGHTERVSSVCFSPDGKQIVSGSHDKTLKVWDARTWTAEQSQGRVLQSPLLEDKFDDASLEPLWRSSSHDGLTVEESDGVAKVYGIVPTFPERYVRADFELVDSIPAESFEARIEVLAKSDTYGGAEHRSRAFGLFAYGNNGRSVGVQYWAGEYRIQYNNGDGRKGGSAPAIGDEKAEWHLWRIAYDATDKTAAVFVDDRQIGSTVTVDLGDSFTLRVPLSCMPNTRIEGNFDNFRLDVSPHPNRGGIVRPSADGQSTATEQPSEVVTGTNKKLESSPAPHKTSPRATAEVKDASLFEERDGLLYPSNKLLEAAVDMESLALDENETLYTSNRKLFSGWVKKYFRSNRSQIAMLADYRNGVINGKSWTWHENGELESIEHHKNNEPHGSHIMWHDNGQKAHEATYKDGKMDGPATQWHENGQLKMESTYKDGKGDGLQTMWHENGKKDQEVNFKEGKKDGLSTAWHENGQKIAETTFKDGKRDGPANFWYENGQKRQETNYKDGKPVDGLLTIWHENGQKQSEATVKDGELDGLATKWHENGEKQQQCIYKDGKEHGPCTVWHENGQKKSEFTFKAGKPHGTGTEWDENGKLISE